MSGTSADGISAVAAGFTPTDDGAPATRLLAHVTRAYSPEQRERLLAALATATPAELCRLDFEIGEWLADAANVVLSALGERRKDVRAVASHGHTFWHEPPRGTLQLGQPAVIAERTGLDVVSGFRTRDVAAGGQGAPLVAIADALLFSAAGQWRVLQNLGGIANLTVAPPRGTEDKIHAFDTGPGVAVIDGVVRALLPSLPYDVDGALAAAGRPIDGVVSELLAHEFFSRRPPKSTGRELFNAAYVAHVLERCRAWNPAATLSDVVATAVALTARSIALAVRDHVEAPVGDVLLSGGGARNPALVRAIAEALAPLPVRMFSDEFFDGEAKEAVAFALLGWLHLAGRAGNVPSATGAAGSRILGCLTPA